jgi:hypothetical protein
MFGPELAIWAAWRQLMSASALKREIDEAKVVTLCPHTSMADFGVVEFFQVLPHARILRRDGWLCLRLQPVIRL